MLVTPPIARGNVAPVQGVVQSSGLGRVTHREYGPPVGFAWILTQLVSYRFSGTESRSAEYKLNQTRLLLHEFPASADADTRLVPFDQGLVVFPGDRLTVDFGGGGIAGVNGFAHEFHVVQQ